MSETNLDSTLGSTARKPSLIIDEPEIKHIVLDFPTYAKTVVELILNSTPQFTVAIFGSWGTGKSTLMKLIEKKLRESIKEEQILTTWFYPWKYDSEKIHDSLPFAITILQTLQTEIEIRIKDKKIKDEGEKLSGRITRVLRGLSVNVGVGFPGIANLEISYQHVEPSGIGKLWGKKVEQFSEQKSKLEEGIELINELFTKIKNSDGEKQTKLVVFIDDLDRCNPDKIVEVFESMKVFLTMPGIIFVIGVSKEIVTEAISNRYGKEKFKFNGEDYLKKFIQLPLTLPIWQEGDVRQYLNNLTKYYVNGYYKKIFSNNFDLILRTVESNPREIKRFLNNFIMTNEVFAFDNEQDYTEFLALQGLQLRWEWFYDYLMTRRDFLNSVNELLFNTQVDPEQILNEEIRDKLTSEIDLVNFLQSEGKLIFEITEPDLQRYRRAGIINNESSFKLKVGDEIEKFKEKLQYKDESKFESKSVISLSMAKKTLENLLNDKTFDFRSFETIKKYVPNFSDEQIQELLLDIGATRSLKNDIHGNELWTLRKSKEIK